MITTYACDEAAQNLDSVPPDWLPAGQVRPLIFGDPALLWLEYHGAQFGFQPETSPYDFLDFVAEKSRHFALKWRQEFAPSAPIVCREAQDVTARSKVEETCRLMAQSVPCIAQPALWWAPERIYGAPDFVVRNSWLRQCFPSLPEAAAEAPDHYVVVDLQFTTKIEDSSKAKDRQSYAAQVRLYSYMLGCLQGVMPTSAFLVTRDRIDNPFPVAVTSTIGRPLDPDLASLRDQFVEIKVNGARYLPWRDPIVAADVDSADERWHTAKQVIAYDKTPGRDVALVYQIAAHAKLELAALGYSSLESLLQAEPLAIPLESIKGIGDTKARQIRAVLQANRTGQPVLPPPEVVPPAKTCEFYVDFEYFSNVNADIEHQWPSLDGHEMVFLIGVGWNSEGQWHFEPLAAEAETLDAERQLLERFIAFLQANCHGNIADADQVAMYHWTSGEVWQAQRAADRHVLPPEHPLRHLPWRDLQKVFLDGPAALPGSFAYGLKEIASALGARAPAYATEWPGELDQGLHAMVMGWQAYTQPDPLATHQLQLLSDYVGADCAALDNILRWLRRPGDDDRR